MKETEKETEIINFVIEEEKKEGRKARDVRKERKGYDIESVDENGDKKFIEVKKRNFPKERFVFLTRPEFMNFVKLPNMWLYVVYTDKEGNHKILKLNREKVLKAVKEEPIITFQLSLRKEITGV